MNDQTNAPEILEAEWDRDQVDALFDDLEKGAKIEHVQVRSTSADRTTDQAVTLRQAHDLLNSGVAKAIQIRYEFDAEVWCDTLMVDSETIRVIRTRMGPSQ